MPALCATATAEIVKQFGGSCGSSVVQIALLTEKIKVLQTHFSVHKKDHASLRGGLLPAVERRKRLLKYLKRKDFSAYMQLVQELGLRH